MSGSLNDVGQRYSYLATSQRQDYGVLPDAVGAQLDSLKRAISEAWPTANENARRRLASLDGCLQRMSSFLLQASRMAAHSGRLASTPLSGMHIQDALPPGGAVALAAHDVCADFEGMLFHGRAALDRLTWFVTSQYRGQETHQYSKLGNVLRTQEHRDRMAAELLRVVSEPSSLRGILVDFENTISLRSKVTHQAAITEAATHAFTIHRLSVDRLLAFDCEALGHPVLTTSHQLTEDVPFVVLNSVAILLGVSTLAKAEFKAAWTNPTAVFSEYIDESGDGPEFSVIRMNPDGFEVKTRHLSSAVLDTAFPITSTADVPAHSKQ